MLETLIKLFERDLHKLEKEIIAYHGEENLWLIDKEILNSAGNLALHLCGNLQHYIGAVLGKSGYIRNRDQEFAIKNVAREKIISEIQTTQDIVKRTLSGFNIKDIAKDYPEKVFSYPMTTEYFLIHVFGHFSYHLGQINYHRRLLDK